MTISSIFQWEKYCVINNDETLYLLTYEAERLKKSTFHTPVWN